VIEPLAFDPLPIMEVIDASDQNRITKEIVRL